MTQPLTHGTIRPPLPSDTATTVENRSMQASDGATRTVETTGNETVLENATAVLNSYLDKLDRAAAAGMWAQAALEARRAAVVLEGLAQLKRITPDVPDSGLR